MFTSDILSLLFTCICLAIALCGLRRTGAPLLRRLSACFSVIIVLDVVRLILTSILGGGSIVTDVADLFLSYTSTSLLLLAGIDTLYADEDVSPFIRKIVGASFPPILLTQIAIKSTFDLTSMLPILKALDSATSAGASIFLGLALIVRLSLTSEWLLVAAAAVGFLLWSMPEAVYWSGGNPTLNLLMSLGGILVTVTTVAAADRRAI